MPRPALTVTALFALASGCATAMPRAQLDCDRDSDGRCEGPRGDLRSAAIGVGALAVMTGGYFLASQPSRPTGQAPATAGPGLVGQIRWEAASKSMRPLRVTLRGDRGSVVQATTSDRQGRFQFALPRKPDWYTVAVATEDQEGETTVWVQHRVPEAFELIVRPRSSPLPPD